MARFSSATWSFLVVAAVAQSGSEQCAGGAGEPCSQAKKGDLYLQTTQSMQTRRQEEAARVFDDSEEVTSVRASCLDETVEMIDLPPDLDQNYYPPGYAYLCQYHVGWEHSDWMLETFVTYGADKDDYLFKVCWERFMDPEVRQFPWIMSAGGDWRYNLSSTGSIIMSPEDQVNTWANGFQNVMPDAMDYFARMGEVVGIKIIPRFMLFGWSKGATYLWPLGRWRQDLVHASLLLHGCNVNGRKWTDDMPFKSKSNGVGPTLFISSKLDTFAKCTYKDTKKQYKNQKKHQKKTYYIESPCGHHPESCWPVCDYLDVYVAPYWDFVREVLPLRQTCTEAKDKKTCDERLGIWDETEGFCGEKYPSRLSRFCERFCPKSEVDSCEALDEATCGMSYKLLSKEQANANGMFSACELVDGACVESSSSYQCFFQDQCP